MRIAERVCQRSSNLNAVDDNGFTVLQQPALAGSGRGVSILLEPGADASVKTHEGFTPSPPLLRWPGFLAGSRWWKFFAGIRDGWPFQAFHPAEAAGQAKWQNPPVGPFNADLY